MVDVCKDCFCFVFGARAKRNDGTQVAAITPGSAEGARTDVVRACSVVGYRKTEGRADHVLNERGTVGNRQARIHAVVDPITSSCSCSDSCFIRVGKAKAMAVFPAGKFELNSALVGEGTYDDVRVVTNSPTQ